jgi:predicted lipid-binding transport protein (Tim44 family)
MALAPDDATAAALRASATALGALGMLAALLFIREWPIALTGSMWAAGTVFAAALWFLRTRYRAEGLASGFGAGAELASGREMPTAPPAAGSHLAATQVDQSWVLAVARACFVDLQAAWDAGDVEALRARTTAEMLDDLLEQLPLRGPGANRTDVVTLEARLLAFEERGPRCVASVEFSGMIRESSDSGAAPFKEVWMLTGSKGSSCGWRLARHQTLL